MFKAVKGRGLDAHCGKGTDYQQQSGKQQPV